MTKRIFLDPGHGYGDPGACAYGVVEAERTFALSSAVKEFILRGHEDEYKVLQTTDVITPERWKKPEWMPQKQWKDHLLVARPTMARWWGADIFVSLHFDSATTSAANGPHCLIYDRRSLEAAEAILEAIGTRTKWTRVHEENKAVLRVAAMYKEPILPAVLLECGFITNENEANEIKGPGIINLALRISIGIKMALAKLEEAKNGAA